MHKYVGQVDICGNGTGQHKATWWHLDSIFWVAKVRSALVRSLDGAAVACGGGGGGGHPKATRWPTRSLHPPAWAPVSAPIRPKTTLPCGDTSSIELYKPNLTRLPFMKFPKYQREHAVKTRFIHILLILREGFQSIFWAKALVGWACSYAMASWLFVHSWYDGDCKNGMHEKNCWSAAKSRYRRRPELPKAPSHQNVQHRLRPDQNLNLFYFLLSCKPFQKVSMHISMNQAQATRFGKMALKVAAIQSKANFKFVDKSKCLDTYWDQFLFTIKAIEEEEKNNTRTQNIQACMSH